MNFLNMFLIRESKHAIKSAIPETEKKQNKGTCDQIMQKYINKIWQRIKTDIKILHGQYFFHKH